MAIKLFDILSGRNLAKELKASQVEDIGREVCDAVQRDLDGRKEWDERSAEAMKLAMQVVGRKNYPFDGASNVKFPVLTISALQFHARAYPGLIPGSDIVRMAVVGEDPSGEKATRAARISKHMSWQVVEEDESWEEQMDKLLMALPIEGCEFKKTWFDPGKGHNVSLWLRPEDLVVPYYTKSLEDSPRITHVLHPHRHEVDHLVRLGHYLKADLHENVPESSPQGDAREQRQGIKESATSETLTLYEQHTWLDLDDDGLLEPYIVTVHKDGQVLRIFPRFTAEDVDIGESGIVRIRPTHHFTKYPFIPSPDGGFYDIGLGHLLGPLTESINTTLNQIIDAGHMYNLQAGFLGKGARLKGGDTPFRLGEWKKVDFQGDDLRKAVMQLPAREPSGVLFSVLGFLVEYANRIGSVTDLMSGKSPGQNQPATTTMALMEQGMMVFNGVFKRIHRALRSEFRKLYDLNRVYLDPETYFNVLDTGQGMTAYLEDYREMNGRDVRPTADPNEASGTQLLAKAEALRQASMSGPGYDRTKVEHRYLEALRIPNIEEVHPIENPVETPPDPKFVIEQAKIQQRASEQEMKYQMQMQKLSIQATRDEAEILNLQASAALAVAKAEREGSVADLETFKAGIDAAENRRKQALETLRILKELGGEDQNDAISGMEGPGADGSFLQPPTGQTPGFTGGLG